MYMTYGLGAATGPQHLVFSLPNYIYVACNAINLTLSNPPSINAIFPNADGSVTMFGTAFASDTRFFLDGAPLTVRKCRSGERKRRSGDSPGGERAASVRLLWR